MNILLFRLWHRCDNLERLSTTQRAYNVMFAGILVWFVTCILPFFAVLLFPETLGGGKTVFTILTVCGGTFLMFLMIGGMILLSSYAASQNRSRQYLEIAYLSCTDRKEYSGFNAVNNSLAYHTEYMEAEKAASTWLTVPLPVKRKWTLIRAGIPADQALNKDIRKMTLEDLHVTTVLHGRRIMAPTKEFAVLEQ